MDTCKTSIKITIPSLITPTQTRTKTGSWILIVQPTMGRTCMIFLPTSDVRIDPTVKILINNTGSNQTFFSTEVTGFTSLNPRTIPILMKRTSFLDRPDTAKRIRTLSDTSSRNRPKIHTTPLFTGIVCVIIILSLGAILRILSITFMLVVPYNLSYPVSTTGPENTNAYGPAIGKLTILFTGKLETPDNTFRYPTPTSTFIRIFRAIVLENLRDRLPTRLSMTWETAWTPARTSLLKKPSFTSSSFGWTPDILKTNLPVVQGLKT